MWVGEAIRIGGVRAVDAGWGIVFLEYIWRIIVGEPVKLRTHDCLTRLVAEYDYAIVVSKKSDDGFCARSAIGRS